jgi:hypothetical protein
MRADALQAFTAYMTTLDGHDDELRAVGLYRWLDWKNLLEKQTGQVDEGKGRTDEGTFVQNGWQKYPEVVKAVARGAKTFASACGKCHTDRLGANTTERMIPLHLVGRFFAPTRYQKEMQAIRATFLRDLYWVQHRGLLTDGHVRNLEDLVDPDRCREGSTLYKQYYTVHTPVKLSSPGPDFPEPYPADYERGNSFRVAKRSPEADRFVMRHRYFTDKVDGDDGHFYWDYQAFRKNYGPYELGTAAPIGLPAAPHPWCASDASQVNDLVEYLLTL